MPARFDIDNVNHLREQAANAICIPDRQNAPPGWSLSAATFEDLVGAFPALRVKRGCQLVGYLWKEGLNGRGAVRAVEEERDCSIENCDLAPYESRVREYPRHAPRPPHALDQFMMAIEGDGSPDSYLGASLFARTLAEFGARGAIDSNVLLWPTNLTHSNDSTPDPFPAHLV